MYATDQGLAALFTSEVMTDRLGINPNNDTYDLPLCHMDNVKVPSKTAIRKSLAAYARTMRPVIADRSDGAPHPAALGDAALYAAARYAAALYLGVDGDDEELFWLVDAGARVDHAPFRSILATWGNSDRDLDEVVHSAVNVYGTERVLDSLTDVGYGIAVACYDSEDTTPYQTFRWIQRLAEDDEALAEQRDWLND